MHETLAVDPDIVARICRSRGVRRLAVFGSAVTDRFDEVRSDVDFLVEFGPVFPDAFDAYFGLAEDLERIFGREVDLVMLTAVPNPYFRSHACADAEELYAA